MLSIQEQQMARIRLHRHRQARAKEIGEFGVDEDAEDEEVPAKEVEAKGSNQQEVVVQDKGRYRVNHKVKGNRQVIFHIPATTVVALDTEPEIVQAREAYADVEEEDEVAIVGDVPEAEAGDVK